MAVTASISLTENSYSVANNSSSVTCKVKVHWTYSSNDRNNLKKTLTFAGSTYTTTTNINSKVTSSGSITLFSKTKNVTHNADGTKTISASVKIPTRTSSGTVTASKSLRLTNIPRYATCSESLNTALETSIKMNWSSNSTIDYIWYSINGGSSWVAAGAVNATSGTYTISGLAQGTTYSIKTRVRRKDSQLTTDSGALSVTTKTYPAPNVYQSLASQTDTTIVMNWSSDVACDYLWYLLDGGSTWVAIGSANATSGSYTISGLTPNTTYSIVTRARGKLSQKTSNSTAISVTTYANNYFTINYGVVDDKTTITSLKVSATTRNTEVSTTDQTKRYSVKWTLYPAGKPTESTVVNSNLVLSDNSTVEHTFTGLDPETLYNIQADFYRGNVGTTLVKSQAVSTTTLSMGGVLKANGKSSSTIGVALVNVAPLDYATRSELLFKNDEEPDTEWETVETVETDANARIELSHNFVALTERTKYDFKVNVYRNGKLIKVYELATSTLVYVPGLTIVPSIKEIIPVPHTGKALVIAESTEPADEEFGIHLLSSPDDIDYTDMGAFDETLIKTATATIGEKVFYKVGVTDEELNVYNESEAIEVDHTDILWNTRVQGEPFDVTEDEIRKMADAMINLYRYLEVTDDVERAGQYYDRLRNRLSELDKGDLVEGGLSIIDSIGDLASSILNGSGYDEGAKGTPIYATSINHMAELVLDALETI